MNWLRGFESPVFEKDKDNQQSIPNPNSQISFKAVPTVLSENVCYAGSSLPF